ncbi:hypothetical protein I4O85_001140 [Clostridioides difficile]
MSRKYSISSMCKLIGVSRSGYYKWLSYSKNLPIGVSKIELLRII